MQCAGSAACFAAFHPLCARAAGYAVATVDAEEDAAAAGDDSDAVGSGDSERENSDANVAGAEGCMLMTLLLCQTTMPCVGHLTLSGADPQQAVMSYICKHRKRFA